MITLTGFDWFMGTLYQTPIRASHVRDLADPVRGELKTVAYDPRMVERIVTDHIDRDVEDYLVDNQSSAYARLLRVDLAAIAANCAHPPIATQLEDRRDLEPVFERIVTDGVKIARRLGLAVEHEPALFIVDEFPEPYSRSEAAILATDTGDAMEFGITPGLYISSNVRPFYTEFILCHELVHVFLGERSPDIFSSRLEEGVAEVLGAGYIALELLGLPLVRGLFIANRLSRSLVPTWERYLEATRQVWSYVLAFGLEGLVTILNGGREALSDLEDRILSGSLDVALTSQDAAVADPDLRALMTSVCLTFPRSLVASPGAALLAPFLAPGTTIREAATGAGLSAGFALVCAKELQDELGLLAIRPDDAVVTFSGANRVAASGMLRYRAPDDDVT